MRQWTEKHTIATSIDAGDWLLKANTVQDEHYSFLWPGVLLTEVITDADCMTTACWVAETGLRRAINLRPDDKVTLVEPPPLSRLARFVLWAGDLVHRVRDAVYFLAQRMKI